MSSTMNLAQLANYLHLPESQVKKLVDRGAIPGRKIGGELVFAREAVHHWLEKKIGLSDESQLVHVETALDRSVPAGSIETTIRLATVIPEGGMAIPLQAKTRDSAIRSMVNLATGTGLLWDAEIMAEAVKQREELHSTALDNGVALLHSRRPMPNILGDSFITLGIASRGIPFGGGFNNLTDVFFLICATDDRIHLRILTRLSRVLTTDGFLEKLRASESESDARTVIAQAEEKFNIED